MPAASAALPRLHFACVHCGKGLKADPAKAGARARCTGCGKAVTVPGLAEPPPRPPLHLEDLPSSRQALDEAELELDDEREEKQAGDASAGPASLYLGGVNLILFLSVAISAGIFLALGQIGGALLGVLCLSGLILCWRGSRLAKDARRLADATGQGAGYAIAGRWSHGLIAVNYVCLLALVGAYLWFADSVQKNAAGLGGLGGLGGAPGNLDLGNLLKPLLEGKKEADKLIDEINKR